MDKHACSSSFDTENIVRLIQLYELHRVLWDSTLNNYRNNDLRQDAWKAISNELKIPIVLLKKKMTSLLATNRKERSKIKKSLVSGSGADDVYISKWFASECFTFLNDKDKPLPTTETAITTSNNNKQNVNESTQQAPSNASSSTQQAPSNASSSTQQAPSNASSSTQQASSNASSSTQQARSNSSSSTQQTPSNSASSTQQQRNTSFRNKRRRNNVETDGKLTEAVGLLKHSVQYLSKDDCYTSFGTHIAHELKKYDSRTLTLVKHAINDIIFQADMGQLPGQSYGYYINNTSPHSTDLSNSTSRQTNYSDTPSPAQTVHTSAPEPQREAEDTQNEILNYYVTFKKEKNDSENS